MSDTGIDENVSSVTDPFYQENGTVLLESWIHKSNHA